MKYKRATRSLDKIFLMCDYDIEELLKKFEDFNVNDSVICICARDNSIFRRISFLVEAFSYLFLKK